MFFMGILQAYTHLLPRAISPARTHGDTRILLQLKRLLYLKERARGASMAWLIYTLARRIHTWLVAMISLGTPRSGQRPGTKALLHMRTQLTSWKEVGWHGGGQRHLVMAKSYPGFPRGAQWKPAPSCGGECYCGSPQSLSMRIH